MKIAIFGGTGRTGIHVVKKALGEGYEVSVLARTPEKMTISDNKLTVIQGDVTDSAAVARTIEGSNAVISSLAPSIEGVNNIVSVMQEQGPRRLIITAGAGINRPGDNPPFMSKIISRLVKTLSPDAYYQTLEVADAVANSGLDWTLVRAPQLVDKPATGSLYVGPLDGNMKRTLTREDYGNFLVAQVNDNSLVGQAPVVSDK